MVCSILTRTLLRFHPSGAEEDKDASGGNGRAALIPESRRCLHDDQRTSAPSAVKFSISTAGLNGHVDAADDFRALAAAQRHTAAQTPSSAGISDSAIMVSRRPQAARGHIGDFKKNR
jgi:hypothetical protein